MRTKTRFHVAAPSFGVFALLFSASAASADPLTTVTPIGDNAPRPAQARTSANPAGIEGGGSILTPIDDFSGYIKTDYTNPPDSMIPLSEQVNPSGYEIAADPWVGAATLAIMQAAGAAHPVGESPAFGAIQCFMAMARATGLDEPNTSFALAANYRMPLLRVEAQAPVMIVQDIYLSSDDGAPRTSLWWSPVVFGGSSQGRMFFGGEGFTTPSTLNFATNEQGVLDRFAELGPVPNTGNVGQFFASAIHPDLPPPVNEWFTYMTHMSVDPNGDLTTLGYSTWVKTPATVAADPPLIDPRMASGQIAAPDGDPAGWVNIYPGREDDPTTPEVVEGIGFAGNVADQPADTSRHLQQSPPLNDYQNPELRDFNGVQYGEGSDPNETDFVPDDYFFGPLRVMGEPPEPTCAGDLNVDGAVNGVDLAQVLAGWGSTTLPALDLNGDGVVNGADLATLLANWGPCR